MFAVKDTRSGKFLKNFSGSLNSAADHSVDLSGMFCMRSVNGAKLYKTKGAVSSSFNSYRFDPTTEGYRLIALAKACPWLQIVPVKVKVAM